MHLNIDKISKAIATNLYFFDDDSKMQVLSIYLKRDRYGNIHLDKSETNKHKSGWEATLIDSSMFQDENSPHHTAPDSKKVKVSGYLVPGKFFVTTNGWICSESAYKPVNPVNLIHDPTTWTLSYEIDEDKDIRFVGPCLKESEILNPIGFIRDVKSYMNMRSYGIDTTRMVDIINPTTYVYYGARQNYGDIADPSSYRLYGDDKLFNELLHLPEFSIQLSRIDNEPCYFQVNSDDIKNLDLFVYRKSVKKYEMFSNEWYMFYDPVMPLVKIKRIIGNHYFVSENGYVCCTDMYESYDWRSHRSKYMLL